MAKVIMICIKVIGQKFFVECYLSAVYAIRGYVTNGLSIRLINRLDISAI